MQTKSLVRFLSMTVLLLAIPFSSFAGVFISVTIAPPALPVYVQPPCPGDGYLWTPGYWAWGPAGYYWVPGTWVVAPRPGLLWTPGYWGWGGGRYIWHAGYWGPHVGFYGGVNYGFGYTGVGFAGGEWRGGTFFYNRSVTNVNVTNVHIFNRTVINRVTVNRVSYNGGAGGINVRPTRDEQIAMKERHVAATSIQLQHEHAASNNHDLLASVNHGRPAVGATARPGEFQRRGAAAGPPARPQNRPMPQQAMNRSVPRPQNSARAIEPSRPAPRRNLDRPANAPRANVQRPANAQRAGIPRPAASRAEDNRPQPHPNAPRAVNNRPQPHPNAPRAVNNRPQPHPNAPPVNNGTQARKSVPRPEEKGREPKDR